MRKEDLKLIINYLHRFVEGPLFSKQKFSAFFRYIGMGLSAIMEKMMGLDYTMVYYTKDESVHNSVYTKCPRRVLKRVFADISYRTPKSFIDVGCGKGYVVTRAYEHPFKKVGGIEYSQVLYDTCCNNLRKKRLSRKNVVHGDAREFDRYGDYNVFFFNNPFDETICSVVAKKIYEAHPADTVYIYYLNLELERRRAIEDAGFLLVKEMPDKMESYFNVSVYTNRKKA